MPKDKIILDFTEEPEDMIIPFGKHQGSKLGDLPNTYIEWCLENFDKSREELLDALQKVLIGRDFYIEDELGK